MNHFVPLALAALSLLQASTSAGMGTQTTAGPLGHERWQRLLQPSPGHETSEQCVVLDAELFAAAAPGLRDVRLLQGNRELPYAVDESHDDRETNSTLPIDDRSIFDKVGTAPFREDGVAGDTGFVRPPSSGFRVAWFTLPAHVPVERITLLGTLDIPSQPLQIIAAPQPATPRAVGEPNSQPEIIQINAASRQSLPITLGANLQSNAAVTVVIGQAPGITSVAFEMRRRELCYKPVTDEPARLVYGDPDAHLIHYDYAQHYQPTATPVLATMGPRQTNPAYEQPASIQPLTLTPRQKLAIAIGLCAGMLAITLGVMLRFKR